MPRPSRARVPQRPCSTCPPDESACQSHPKITINNNVGIPRNNIGNDFANHNKCPVTKKQIAFASSPVGDKSVKAIPGIGKHNAELLNGIGITRARTVLGKFLEFNLNREAFENWLQGLGIAEIHSSMIFHSIKRHAEAV
ncbi:hypothetical protein TCAL_13920 [Tigriopus californicus]|uniref:Uncharacterized protein n=1 Tax=Tigriopus californicus TaxID=6832 RepID=A0A553PCS8_TIGCA|nr:hypothetical protein TCAL_13920 [Tigriopus californicus]|eukprot:TCALIF_13920-PA protein Name:"Similar to banf1-a Barrier-to-autointegration factor A (Xenopus laevis)" AED:0.24 eAED:0.24 QI:0/-1/0/1/-1/1/1/0/139